MGNSTLDLQDWNRNADAYIGELPLQRVSSTGNSKISCGRAWAIYVDWMCSTSAAATAGSARKWRTPVGVSGVSMARRNC